MSLFMLNNTVVEQILRRLPDLTIGVLGDLFLDRYLDLDAALTEPSLETGLDAYQVVQVRSYPGAAGTVINNLAALGVGRICPVAVLGDDGEGYELRAALAALGKVDPVGLFADEGRRTPTYIKPMLHSSAGPPRELNRIDIKNRTVLSEAAEERILRFLEAIGNQCDALVVLDQVSEADCGVVTARVRDRLAEMGQAYPDKLILADSRLRVGLFRGVSLKPNRRECLHAVAAGADSDALETAVVQLARQGGRPVFCTDGAHGILVADPNSAEGPCWSAADPVSGPIDPVGAGDSTSAALVSALASGATNLQAAAFANLVASITVQQIGTTGTASPEQVRQRWGERAGR
jgi:rfaE bifunctional protein kinase chain/domain